MRSPTATGKASGLAERLWSCHLAVAFPVEAETRAVRGVSIE